MSSGQPTPPSTIDGGQPQRIQALFDHIVPRYDLLNDLLTAGQHRRWRRRLIALAQASGSRALDVGTGTGDLALALRQAGARQVIGVDFVPAMLTAAQAKARRQAASDLRLVAGDALRLPILDRAVDCLSSGFLLRNVAAPALALAEMYRVLAPGGRLVCLETSRPNQPLGRLALWLFGRLSPLLGHWVASAPDAYRYLPESTARFADADELADQLRQAGFERVGYQRLALGLIAIHYGRRPPADPLPADQSSRPPTEPATSPPA